MKKAALILFLLLGHLAVAQVPLQKAVDAAAKSKVLKNASWGFCAVDSTGKAIASRNAATRLIPASNMKLVTTGTALVALKGDFTFSTDIYCSGTVDGGVLNGDVYIVGGGDPTTAARDSLAMKPESLFWKWKSFLRSAGISAINGRIIADGTAYEGYPEDGSWNWEDIGTYYGTGAYALNYYGNSQDYAVSAGAAPGSAVNVSISGPLTPWMHFVNRGVTGPAGSGNSLYLYTTDLAPESELRGSFAIDRKPKTEHFANKYPELTCAYAFYRNLLDTGWIVRGYGYIDRDGRVSDLASVDTLSTAPRRRLGVTRSAKLADIVRATNVRSDNLYAEAIFRRLGEEACGVCVPDSCRAAVFEVLASLGVGAGVGGSFGAGPVIVDGSGLSRKNAVSPQWMASYLRAMASSKASSDFIASLPAPGQGTLAGVLKNEPGAGRIRMKSGSMEGVLCYSGYVLSEDLSSVQLTFSLMVNGASAKYSDIRAALVPILAAML